MLNFISASMPRRVQPLFLIVLFSAAVFSSGKLHGQIADQITTDAGSAKLVVLPNHHPQWASPANSAGLMPSETPLDHLTMVLSRSPQQEAALEKFLADQQDRSSPDYHHWLTSAEMGERFGLSEHDIAALSAGRRRGHLGLCLFRGFRRVRLRRSL